MGKMDELFNEMCEYCEENSAWDTWMTIKDWNGCMGKAYGPASFTALVNDRRLKRREGYRNTYEYHIVTIEMIEEEKKRNEIKEAERIVDYHDEKIASIKARYEEMIKQAEEQYQRYMDFEAEQWEKAKAILAENELKKDKE